MRAKLKGLHSPDISDLENWQPEKSSFGFLLRAMIGPADREGAESFDMMVCTPEFFREQLRGVMSGMHTLFMPSYDYSALRNFIERAVHRAEAEDWEKLAARLSWLGHWEFADYRSEPPYA
jgi:Immunity protein 8